MRKIANLLVISVLIFSSQMAFPISGGSLHEAVLQQDIARIRALLGGENAVSLLNSRNNLNMTPLHVAAGMGWHESVGALIDGGADVKARADGNRTPLHLAVFQGKDLTTVRLLLGAGADPNAQDAKGQTSLHCALSVMAIGILEELMLRGGDPSIPDNRGRMIRKLDATGDECLECR